MEEYFLTLVGPRVTPATRPWESGLPIEDGHTIPFVVDRGWVGPAGTYIEQWSIRTGDTVLYRHPPSTSRSGVPVGPAVQRHDEGPPET